MSEFFDHEAVVSEGSEDEEVRDEIKKHKKSKSLKMDEDSDEEEDDDGECLVGYCYLQVLTFSMFRRG